MKLTQRCAGKSSGAARRAMLPQVCRTCATDEAHRADPAGDQTRVRLLAHAHDAIDAFFHEIHRTKAQPQLQAQIGISGEELRQLRNDEQSSECAGHVDAQPPLRRDARLHHRRFRLLEIRKDARATLIERRALRRHRHAPCGALEQTRSQMRLEVLHQIADGCFRQVQRFCLPW